jgi:hypothetical protein
MSELWNGAEMPRGTPTYFSLLLRCHLRDGVRPIGKPGKPGVPWVIEDFADQVGQSVATIRAWLSGARRPKYTIRIEDVLFGRGNDAYGNERAELRTAHEAVRRRCLDFELEKAAAKAGHPRANSGKAWLGGTRLIIGLGALGGNVANLTLARMGNPSG